MVSVHRLLRVGALLGAASALVLLGAQPASAAPYYYGYYPLWANENAYPNGDHNCGGGYGWFTAKTVTKAYGGHTYTVKLCYSNSYGAYGRISGGAVNDPTCSVLTYRKNADGSQLGGVGETIDSGLTWAYTKIANDLNGRLANAVLWCNGATQASTGWY